MSTTTIRLPESLKERVAALADAAGVSTHGFIIEAIEAHTRQAEEAAAFERLALQRLRRIERSGQAIAWEDARSYLIARADGQAMARPKPRPLAARTRSTPRA